jgi:putative membrane protein
MIITVAVLLLGITQAMAASPFDTLFLRHEAQNSAYETAIAQLAQNRAIRPEVKAFAAGVANDHESYNGGLRDLAQAKGVPVPPDMTASNKKHLDALAATQGAAFDTAFLREMRRINGVELRSFRREASRTADKDIRAFVTKFLPMEEKHEADARALSGRAVASRMPVITPPAVGAGMPVITPPSGGTMPVVPPPAPGAK